MYEINRNCIFVFYCLFPLQIRASGATIARAPGVGPQIRQAGPVGVTIKHAKATAVAVNQGANIVVSTQAPPVVTTIKVGSTQIKPVVVSTQSIAPVVVSSAPAPAPPVVAPPPTIVAPPPPPAPAKTTTSKAQNSTQATAKAAAASKEKERKASSSFYQQSSMSSSMYGDDDINDVAAMGGVNLAEESQRILGSTEMIGTQIRSCKDEIFLHLPALQAKIRNIIARHGLEEPMSEVAVLVSHACQERLKNIVEKLAVIAEHRIDIIKVSVESFPFVATHYYGCVVI